MARQRGNGGPNPHYGSQRQHSGSNNYMRDDHGGGYNNNNYNHQYNGGPSSNNHNALGGDSHYSMNSRMDGGGVKRECDHLVCAFSRMVVSQVPCQSRSQ